MAMFSEKDAKATAGRLGMKDAPGVVVGKEASTGQTCIQSWADLSIDIRGSRVVLSWTTEGPLPGMMVPDPDHPVSTPSPTAGAV